MTKKKWGLDDMKKSFSTYLKDYLMLLVLIALIILFSILGPVMANRNFFNFQNLLTMLNQNAYLVILGVGITFIMLGGAMDLSTGYLISTVGMAMALIETSTNVVVAVICGILLAVLLSGFNGVMYSWLKVFPFIITLGTQYILNGATYLLTGGISKTIYISSAMKNIGGYNISIGSGALKTGVIVMIIAVLIGSFILNKTYLGRNIYALGSNPDAVALSGVSVAKMRTLIFALAGVFFGIGQIVNVGTTGGAVNQGLGIGAEFTVMAGAMLGGVKMGGGGGKMSNMVIGVLIIGVLDYGMSFLNINQYWKYVVLGIALLAAVTMDTLQTRAAANAAKKVTGQAPAETSTTK
jgi:ribose/xylose/arabinose/galactoside ABC-type transport system permease subunit